MKKEILIHLPETQTSTGSGRKKPAHRSKISRIKIEECAVIFLYSCVCCKVYALQGNTRRRKISCNENIYDIMRYYKAVTKTAHAFIYFILIIKKKKEIGGRKRARIL
jgi:hypothetical protein